MTLQEQIITLIVLLALSAFFSGSETALVSLSRLKVRHWAEKGGGTAKILKKLKDDPQRMLTTILIGNNLVNVAAAAIATSVALQVFESNAIGISTGVMTFLILVFGEITPKSLATQFNEPYAKFVALPIWYLSIILYPLIKMFGWFFKILIKMFGGTVKKPTVTEEYLKSIVTVGEEEGSINEMEKDMINKIFEFDDINVSEIMTPKTDMFMVSSKLRIKDVIIPILKNQFSRIPVYEKSKDNMVGIIYLRDVMKHMTSKKRSLSLDKMMKKPYFVPETKKIDSLLKQFQKRKEHMAIVVDEHGTITGLVTIEDILEEIVGEIMDESDKRDPNIRKIKAKEWMVKGKADIDEVNEKININIAEDENYDTLGGFILSKTGKIPQEHEKIEHGKFNLIVEEVGGNRIIRVKVVKQ
ncbi:HlyC/CorC family transporter [Candidatus Woesearchaeota archaeon]|nr:HlyC/CorC family transporter [Candidatus Woesearchaeota archaeon]